MATYAIGDIHANLPALSDLLARLRPELSRGDVVVFLGDFVDRGSDAKGCIDAILEFEAQVDAEIVGLCGNHEDWMLRTMHDYRRHSWYLGMQPLDTISSYSPAAAEELNKAARAAGTQLYLGGCELPYGAFFEAMPAAHRAFFEGLRTHYQCSDCICAHAGVDPSFPLELPLAHPRESLVWGVRGFPRHYAGSSVVVYGHRNNAELDDDDWPHPAVFGRTFGIDTIAHGVLTAMRFPDGRVFQSGRYAKRPLDR
jgi:serine/threonine protein phosphatase 1